jgi:hypothetical protein
MSMGSHGGVVLTGENRRTRRKTCPSATLSTTNTTRTGSCENSDLCSESSPERSFHVKCVPCHHGTVHSQIAHGGECIQIWTVAANILNKQSQTADKGCPTALGGGLTAPHLTNIITRPNNTGCLKNTRHTFRNKFLTCRQSK